MACSPAAGWRRRHLLARLFGGSLLPAIDAGAQVRPALHILSSGASAQDEAVARILMERFPGTALTQLPDVATSRLPGAPNPAAYVAVGAQALESAAALALKAPLLSLLASRQAFQRVASSGQRRAGAMTAIHAEPSPAQQMAVIRALFARSVTVAVLVSDATATIGPALHAAARRQELALKAVRYAPEVGLLRNLARVAEADALLIFPDSTIYTPQTLREVLETTYRRRQPVIGFSAALVTAGTLASAFTSVDDLTVHAVQLLGEVLAGRLPTPQYPRYWQMAVNDSVARSLDIVIDPAARHIGERP